VGEGTGEEAAERLGAVVVEKLEGGAGEQILEVLLALEAAGAGMSGRFAEGRPLGQGGRVAKGQSSKVFSLCFLRIKLECI
jgi:hypothetical protein